jgi:GcrA cell cycle regulator
MDWTDESIADLRRLWGEGHSTAAIAKLMGTTKNAVVGKAHRLDLPARPSLIIRDGRPRRPVAGAKRTLPSLGAAARPVMAAPAPRAPVAAAPLTRLGGPCRFPIGEPGTAEFSFCGKPATGPRKPYCAACSERAYARPLVSGEAMAPRGWVA